MEKRVWAIIFSGIALVLSYSLNFYLDYAAAPQPSLPMVVLYSTILLVVAASVITMYVMIALDAKQRGQSPWWFLLGLFLGPLGAVIYYAISKGWDK